MNNFGKALGTLAVWGGVALVIYLFHSFDILNGIGGGIMAFGAFLMTMQIWE